MENRLAALEELLIYRKEIASNNSKEFICKAVWNYVIMWYYVYKIWYPLTFHILMTIQYRDPKIELHFETFAMDFIDFAPLWS